MSAILTVRLKITDLTAWTALETGRRMLGSTISLSRIVREQLLLFEPLPGERADSFEKALGEAVRHSNFFVNPNKESFSLLAAAERGASWTPPEGAWGILSRQRDDTQDAGIKERLLREHPMPGLQAIRRAKVWWLWTRGSDGGSAVDTCAGILGVLRDQKHGLLVNPHAEASMILTEAVPWSRIEAFLIEPAPSFQAAA